MKKSLLLPVFVLVLAAARVPAADESIPNPLPWEPATQYKPGDGALPQTITSPLGKPMKLVWNDEFNAVTDTDGQPYIDRSKWQTTFWQGTWCRTLGGNGEAEMYLDKDDGGKGNIPADQRPNPFSFETPGILTISAQKVPQSLWDNYGLSQKCCFSSGLLISDRRFTMKYGYVEGRFKAPMERGSWPAFWMLADDIPVAGYEDVSKRPNDPKTGTWFNQADIDAHRWPPEIDILESIGVWITKFDTGYIGPKDEKIKVSQWLHDLGTNLGADFHTWGYEWDENNMVWTMDGKIIAHGNVTKSFQRPFYFLINLAVGGTWYSQVQHTTPWEVDESTMPWKMECDYVRVYQADPGTPPSAPLTPPVKGAPAGSMDPQAR